MLAVKVKNSVAVNLLFMEAYHNYIKCLYPCANTDATVLAGILMQLNNGDYDPLRPVNTIVKYGQFYSGFLHRACCCLMAKHLILSWYEMSSIDC